MTSTGEKFFFFFFSLNFLLAATVPLEFSLVPKINCHDLNNNGHPDFIAFSNIDLPRSIYHIEFLNNKIEILWEYKISINNDGYFIDMIFGDYDNDGFKELITTTYQEDEINIIYIFSTNNIEFYNDPPIITDIKNTSIAINNPHKIYSMFSDKTEQSMFIITQGSPNRHIVLCEFINGEILSSGTVGENFIKKTSSRIDISLGDFNGDSVEDIFILDNGFNPAGIFIYSNGDKKELNLKNYSRLKLLYERGVDINFDGIDDLIFINRNGQLMSNIWNAEAISLSNDKIQDIIVTADNGFIYITSISKSGKISSFSIDPITKGILFSDIILPEYNYNYSKVYNLFTDFEIILSHNGKKPEIWIKELSQELISRTPPLDYIQRIYYRKPDYFINFGEVFYHEINKDENIDFRNFKEEYIPSGMDFDIDKVQLKWKPERDQLGYHQLSYYLELRKKGDLVIEVEGGKKTVNQSESLLEKSFSYLIYVNDPLKINLLKNKFTTVNKEIFELIIPIDDENVDTHLNIEKISGNNNATIKMIKPEIIVISDTLNTPLDTMEIDTIDLIIHEKEINLDTNILSLEEKPLKESTYLDTVTTEFEKFTKMKREGETDPLKKKKLKKSDEEFKTKEEEYREKLKTHKKILRDGKNIWVPIDSLNQDNITALDTIVIDTTLLDTTALEKLDEIKNKIVLEETVFHDQYVDTVDLTNQIEDSVKIEIDTNYFEISFKEVVSHQAKFKWTPDIEPGDYDFFISANDGFSSDSVSFTVTVHPEIDVSMNKTKFIATIDKVFSTQIKLEQRPRSSKYIYSFIGAPENMKIDSLGNINWVPIHPQVDEHNFKIKVSDGIAEKIIPINIYVNAPPVISSRPPKIYFLLDGEKLLFPLESFDLNNSANLTWKLLFGPVGMSISSEGILSWENTKLGHHLYEIQLSDGIDSVQWVADIYINSKPEITSKPIKIVEENKLYKYSLSAWDANKMSPFDSLIENKISFSIAQGPKGINIDENNLLSWNTKNVPLDEYKIQIIASDGIDNDIQTFSLFINSLPKITSSDSISVHLGKELQFQIESNDNNFQDTLTFHLDPLIGNMIMELHSGLLTWTPKETNIGLNNFRLQVKDGKDNDGTIIPLKVFVYNPPILTSELSKEAFTDIEYSEFITAEDMFGKKLTDPQSIIIDSASFNYYNLSQYAHLFKWTPRDVDQGIHKMVIKITDEYGFVTHHHHNITVFSNPCIHCNKNNLSPADTTSR